MSTVDITLRGMESNAPDNSQKDGAMCELINLRLDDAALRPMGNKQPVSQNPIPYTSQNPYFIHVMDMVKHIITVHPTSGKIAWYEFAANLTTIPPLSSIETYGLLSTQLRFNSIGNVLVIYDDQYKTITYAIWESDKAAYQYISTPLPLPVLETGIASERRPQGVNYQTGKPVDMAYIFEEIAVDQAKDLEAQVKTSVDAAVETFRNGVKVRGENATDGYFYLTYAYQLFDGSYVKHSMPYCLYGGWPLVGTQIDSSVPPQYVINDLCIRQAISDSSKKCRWDLYNLVASSFKTKLINAPEVAPLLAHWKGIVVNLSIFATLPKEVKVSDCVDIGNTVDNRTVVNAVEYADEDYPHKAFERASTFYRVAEIPFDELVAASTKDYPLAINPNKMTANPVLTLDNQTSHILHGNVDLKYNERILLGNTSTQLFRGWPTSFYNAWRGGISGRLLGSRVHLETTNGARITDSGSYPIVDGFTNQSYSADGAGTFGIAIPLILSYPDIRARQLELLTSQGNPVNGVFSDQKHVQYQYLNPLPEPWSNVSVNLKAHPYLNVAYGVFLREKDTTQKGKTDILRRCKASTLGYEWHGTSSPTFLPTIVSQNGPAAVAANAQPIVDPNRVQATEYQNPFLFPVKDSVRVGGKQVTGLSVNATPISQGQFGQFPIFTFTEEGMYAIGISPSPFFTSISPLNGEVCLKASSILPLGFATAFIDQNGQLKLIAGGQVINLSETLDRQDNFLRFGNNGIDKIIASDALGQTIFSIVTFEEYVAGTVRLAYDLNRQEIWIVNQAWAGSYVYSLKSKSWAKSELRPYNLISSYPSTYAITKDFILDLTNDVKVQLAEDDFVHVFFQTQKIDVEFHGFKRIARAVLRSSLNVNKTFGLYLFASEDGYSWRVLNWREVSGVSYKTYGNTVRDMIMQLGLASTKYVAFVGSGRLRADSFITALSLHAQPTLTDKLR